MLQRWDKMTMLCWSFKILQAKSRLRILLSYKHVLPVIKKGGMNQKEQEKAQAKKKRAMENCSQALRPNQSCQHLTWLNFRISLRDYFLLLISCFEQEYLSRLSYACPTTV